MSDTDPSQVSETARRLSALEAELVELKSEIARFRALLGLEDRDTGPRVIRTDDRSVAPTLVQVNGKGDSNAPRVSQNSTSSEKVAIFRSLFVGRDDVYARAWSSQRTGKAGWSPAVLGGVANAKSPDREYLPYTEEVVERHLAGELHVGTYPLLYGDVCRLLASDFDGPGWALDAGAYLDVARSLGIPALSGTLAIGGRRSRLDLLRGSRLCLLGTSAWGASHSGGDDGPR